MTTNDPSETRTGPNGQRLCSAHKTNGDACSGYAMQGQRVCKVHGGKAPQNIAKAKMRLIDLVDPAVATLAREMVQAEQSRDKQAAANSILDRAGFGRSTTIQTEDARELLIARIREMKTTQVRELFD